MSIAFTANADGRYFRCPPVWLPPPRILVYTNLVHSDTNSPLIMHFYHDFLCSGVFSYDFLSSENLFPIVMSNELWVSDDRASMVECDMYELYDLWVIRIWVFRGMTVFRCTQPSSPSVNTSIHWRNNHCLQQLVHWCTGQQHPWPVYLRLQKTSRTYLHDIRVSTP